MGIILPLFNNRKHDYITLIRSHILVLLNASRSENVTEKYRIAGALFCSVYRMQQSIRHKLKKLRERTHHTVKTFFLK